MDPRIEALRMNVGRLPPRPSAGVPIVRRGFRSRHRTRRLFPSGRPPGRGACGGLSRDRSRHEEDRPARPSRGAPRAPSLARAASPARATLLSLGTVPGRGTAPAREAPRNRGAARFSRRRLRGPSADHDAILLGAVRLPAGHRLAGPRLLVARPLAVPLRRTPPRAWIRAVRCGHRSGPGRHVLRGARDRSAGRGRRVRAGRPLAAA